MIPVQRDPRSTLPVSSFRQGYLLPLLTDSLPTELPAKPFWQFISLHEIRVLPRWMRINQWVNEILTMLQQTIHAKNTKSQIVQKSIGKSKHLCSSYFPALLQLYKPSVKMVSWKYFQIYFMSALLHLPSLYLFMSEKATTIHALVREITTSLLPNLKLRSRYTDVWRDF